MDPMSAGLGNEHNGSKPTVYAFHTPPSSPTAQRRRRSRSSPRTGLPATSSVRRLRAVPSPRPTRLLHLAALTRFRRGCLRVASATSTAHRRYFTAHDRRCPADSPLQPQIHQQAEAALVGLPQRTRQLALEAQLEPAVS